MLVNEQLFRNAINCVISSKTSLSRQLFQLTLSDQSVKPEDKTARLCGIFFLNKFMKTSYASPVQ